jgi:hypothetical protein
MDQIHKVKITTNPSEFLGITKCFQKLTHNSLEPLVKENLVEFYQSSVINENFIDKFEMPAKLKNKHEEIVLNFQAICLETLGVLFTSNTAVERFGTLKNEQIKIIIQKLYNTNDENYQVIVCLFVANLSMYGKHIVKELELEYIIGNNDFDCLINNKYNKVLIKRLNGACNYYDICTSEKNVNFLVSRVEFYKETNIYDEGILQYINKLLISFYMTLKLNNKKLKKRIDDVSINILKLD